MPDLTELHRRAEEYRALATAASDEKQRVGLLSVATLLETLAQGAVEREGAQQRPKAESFWLGTLEGLGTLLRT